MLNRLKKGLLNIDNAIGERCDFGTINHLYLRYRTLFLPILIIGLLAHIYELTEFSLHMDSELEGFKKGPHYIWLQNGRWAAFLINSLFLPDPVIPAIPILISVLGIVLASCILLVTLSAERQPRDYLAAAILVSSPIHYFAFYYYSLGYVVGIAFTLCAYSVYSLANHNYKKSFFIMLGCITFSTGIYQAMIVVVATMFALYSLNAIIEENIDIKTILQKSALVLICALVAILFNKIIGSTWLFIEGKQYNAPYISGFNNFDLSISYFKEFIPSTLLILKNYYNGHEDYYLYNLVSLHILFLLSLAIIIYRIFTLPKSINVKFLALAFFVLLLMAPAFMLLMGGPRENPPRTMGSITVALFGLVFLAYSVNSHILKNSIVILVVVCCINFVIVNQRYALSSHLAWQADRDFSNQLLIRLNDFSHKLPHKPIVKNDKLGISGRNHPLIIIGSREKYFESPLFVQRNVVGASFFNWTANATHKIIALWGSMGNFDYWPANRVERRSVIQQSLAMPIWPSEGSVKVINGITVIKLNNYSHAEINNLCPPTEKILACAPLIKMKE